jgi:hypothetical protein
MRKRRAGAEVIATLVDEFAKTLQQANRLHALGIDRQAIVPLLATAQEIIGAIHVEMRVQGLHHGGSDGQSLSAMQGRLEAAMRTLTLSTSSNSAAD